MKKRLFSNILMLGILLGSLALVVTKTDILKVRSSLQTNISGGLRVIKITEEKYNINDKNISINIKMPQIHYYNKEVERYMNSYIRKNINQFINNQRQIKDTVEKKDKSVIDINYYVAFEDSNLLNIVITRDTKSSKNNTKFEKDSYIFDLKTGQRIFLDNFLKNNEDYKEVIKNHIIKTKKDNKEGLDMSRINIDKYTNYSIIDGGISVYFNPYKESGKNIAYEFKIPHSIFKNKISVADTDSIEANIDTQTITENNEYINSVINIPIITTSNKTIEKSINDKIRNDIMSFYNNAQEEAKKYLGDNKENKNKFVVNINFDVEKNSNNMLSIKVRYYQYSGGAHGMYEDISYNIDMRDGKFLNLDDFFKEGSDYKIVIDKEIRKQIEELVKENKENEGIYQFSGIKKGQKYYVRDDSLVIYFDLYDIAPYAAGIPEFPIKVDVIDHILKEKYLDIFK